MHTDTYPRHDALRVHSWNRKESREERQYPSRAMMLSPPSQYAPAARHVGGTIETGVDAPLCTGEGKRGGGASSPQAQRSRVTHLGTGGTLR